MTELPEIHEREPESWRVRDPQAHARAVRGMFARISGVYDRLNHLLSLNLDHRWRRDLAARLDADVWEVLDLCAGTGDLALACRAAGRGRVWLAVDFTPEMLQRGRHKPGADDLHWLAGDGQRLPLPDGCVDAVVVGFGVRNLADVRGGVREMARVLRAGGQLMVLDFFRAEPTASGPSRGPAAPVRLALASLLPMVARLAGGDGAAYRYLPGSMDRFLSPDEFAALLSEEGFTDILVARQTMGVAHLVGGRRDAVLAERYLPPDRRRSRA